MASTNQQRRRSPAQVAVRSTISPRRWPGRRGRCAAVRTRVCRSRARRRRQFRRPSLRPLSTTRKPRARRNTSASNATSADTRMYGRPDQVGKELKCPDCGARTVVPPPPPPKRKTFRPRWKASNTSCGMPTCSRCRANCVAAAAEVHRRDVPVCDTLMYATEKQVGQSIACPDCGTTHVVPAPPKPKPKRSCRRSDADTPELDPAAAPGRAATAYVARTAAEE